MKVPLEPIPTEQMATASVPPPSRARVSERKPPAVSAQSAHQPGQLHKAYPWLLGTSLCMSALLCWLYVSKPVIAPAAVAPSVQTSPAEEAETSNPVVVKPAAADGKIKSLAPSETRLPGEQAEPTAAPPEAPVAAAPLKVAPGKLAALRGNGSAEGLGWESTNLKVQHILSADSGGGELEKIILNVPVRYQTRTMRWTTADIEKARNVLARLMIYERDLNALRQQGEGILNDWNSLLENTVPSSVLRADSPSLPYNHGNGASQTDLPDSTEVIKVDKSEEEPAK